MAYRKNRAFMLATYLLLAVLFITCVMPAYAAEMVRDTTAAIEAASEFDFSASDSIDKYDTYKKQELVTSSGNTVAHVDTAVGNSVDTIRIFDRNRAISSRISVPGKYHVQLHLRIRSLK